MIESATAGMPQAYPYSQPAEAAILGAMIQDPSEITSATSTLISSDFYLDSHRRIYRALAAMAAHGVKIDFITLVAELERTKELNAIGGPSYLAFLTEGIPRNYNVDSYIQIVKDKSLLREVIKVAELATTRARDQSEAAWQVVAWLQEQTFDIQAEDSSGGPEKVETIVPQVVERVLSERERSGDEILGMVTGVHRLDVRLGGLRENEYTILAADAGSGKTAFAVQITVENCHRGVPCLWFSLEMTKQQLVSRIFSSIGFGHIAKVKAAEMRDPRRISKATLYDFYQLGDRVTGLPLWIDDDAGLDLSKLLARARLAVRRQKVKLIVVDYLQLVHVADGKLNEAQRLEKITFGLRDLAKTEGCHVIALSQYSYAEDGNRKRLKGSSSLRQSCQNLLMLELEEEDTGTYTGKGQIRIDKMREGAKGKIECEFDTDHLRFYTSAR